MIDPAGLRHRAQPIDRSSDRRVAVTALGIAVAFLSAAALATFLPPAVRHGAWLPLHLAHLVPAVGPGDQVAHARQRRTLGRHSGVRLIATNVGTARWLSVCRCELTAS